MNINANDSDSSFSEVKPEPTEISIDETPEYKHKPEFGESHIPKDVITDKALSSGLLDKHVKSVGKIKPRPEKNKYKCDACRRSFTYKVSLMNHMETKCTGTKFHCSYCPKAFFRKREVVQHVKSHFKGSDTLCEICSKSFKSRATFLRHVRLHSEERNYKCEICTDAYKTKSQLLSHIKTHNNKTYCKICTKCFKSGKKYVDKHMEKHRNNDVEKGSCDDFSPTEISPEFGESHITKDVTTDQALFSELEDESMRKIKKPRPEKNKYKCDACRSSFTYKVGLMDHKETKCTGTKFHCSYCPKAFFGKREVVQHVKSHFKGSDTVCEICSKIFKSRRAFLQHVRLHSKERDYKCEICTKTYKTKSQLLSHVKTHNNKTYCKICKCFKSGQKYVDKHMEKHRNNDDGNETDDIVREMKIEPRILLDL